MPRKALYVLAEGIRDVFSCYCCSASYLHPFPPPPRQLTIIQTDIDEPEVLRKSALHPIIVFVKISSTLGE